MKPYTVRILSLLYLILLISVSSCKSPANIEDAMLKARRNFYFVNVSDYPSERSSLPIGIFDSGTGGLSVLNDIITYTREDCTGVTHPFRNESFIFTADMANMPYGNYSSENNTGLLVENVMKDVQFLLGNKYYQSGRSKKFSSGKEPVKAIVIACNTATAYALDTIRNFIDKSGLDLGVLGVIDAGATGAIRNFKPDDIGCIAVLATDGTVKSGAYVRTIQQRAKESGLSNCIVIQQAGIGIAESIDESKDFFDRNASEPREEYKGPSESRTDEMKIDMSLWDRYDFDTTNKALLFEGDLKNPEKLQINSVENYISFHVVCLMEKIRTSGSEHPLKSIVLGCTHYPFFEDEFHNEFMRLRDYREKGRYIYRSLIDTAFVIVNPAVILAGQLEQFLKEEHLMNESSVVKNEFFISVPDLNNRDVKLRKDGTFTYEYKYGRKPGEIQEYVKFVPFNRNSVTDDISRRLSLQIPVIYEMIVNFDAGNPKTGYLRENEKIKP